MRLVHPRALFEPLGFSFLYFLTCLFISNLIISQTMQSFLSLFWLCRVAVILIWSIQICIFHCLYLPMVSSATAISMHNLKIKHILLVGNFRNCKQLLRILIFSLILYSITNWYVCSCTIYQLVIRNVYN